jgi:transposase
MIVIGVDVRKHSLTAVAVDEAGRMLDEKTVTAAGKELVLWASQLSSERRWWLRCRVLATAAAGGEERECDGENCENARSAGP